METRSGRQLIEEVTRIRLGASNQSIWSIAATVGERARAALNDAIRTFPVFVYGVENSIWLSGSGYAVVPDRVVGVHAVFADVDSIRQQLTGAVYRPTDCTNIVYISPGNSTFNTWITVEAEVEIPEIPQDIYLSANVATTSPTVSVANPGNMRYLGWPSQGYAELCTINSLGAVEVVYYNSITPSGLNVQRGMFGTQQRYWALSSTVSISPVLMLPKEMLSVYIPQAEANMFNFWIGNRALYDQYTAIAALNQVDIEQLLVIVRHNESVAKARFDAYTRRKNRKRIPEVGYVEIG